MANIISRAPKTKTSVTIPALSAALFVLLACSRGGPGMLQPPPPQPGAESGISVSGECLKKVVQDRGAVSVASTSVLPTPKDASEKVIAAHEVIKTKVKELGLKDFESETVNYSVNEERQYENKKWVSKGFRATITTRFVTSELARVGEVIALASQQGAENVGGLETFVSPARLKEERESCLEVATQDAAAKAAKIAAGAGVKVGEILSINENEGSGRFMVSKFGGPEMMMADAAPTAGQRLKAPVIESRAVDLVVSVRARFGVRQ